jgi:hypothetical protein
MEIFHYRLARDLHQLNHAQALVTNNANEIYHYRCRQRGMAQGNIKIEPLVLWNTNLHAELDHEISRGLSTDAIPNIETM